jgi:tetratricopeptide (TPR) repeat protein
MSGPEFRPRRALWAAKLAEQQFAVGDQNERRNAMINNRLANVLDPENVNALNNLAWALASVPSDPWFDPAQALALARKAVARQPHDWRLLNTLGVAAFRARDWQTAAKVLQESLILTGGAAHDSFFLAMTFWRLGNKKKARELYDQAVAWTDKNKPHDPELRQFRAEAEELMTHHSGKAQSERQHSRVHESLTETVPEDPPSGEANTDPVGSLPRPQAPAEGTIDLDFLQAVDLLGLSAQPSISE